MTNLANIITIQALKDEKDRIDINLVWGTYTHKTMVRDTEETRYYMAIVYGMPTDAIGRFFDGLIPNVPLQASFPTNIGCPEQREYCLCYG